MTEAAQTLARVPGGIAVVTLENAGSATLARGVTTFGQVFEEGALKAGGALVAQIGGRTVPVQVDVKTTWPDGSAKMAVLSLERPTLGAGEAKSVVLVAETASAPAAAPLDMASALAGHSFTVALTPTGGAAIQIDVLQALQDALANGTASFWQSGPLATQARVEIMIPGGSQRLLFDVTAYQGGGFEVDAMFNNDRAMEAAGGRVAYGVVVTMNGRQVASETVDQGQYQNWHREFASNATDGGQGLGSPDRGWLNIRHDIETLKELGVVPQYDTTLTIPETMLQSWQAATQSASWDDPLSARGLTQYMPTTGGRGDIGFTTQANAAWLISGDPRAAAFALGQAEAAGAVPWNFYDAANRTWLNTDDYPNLWSDPRGGTGRPGDPTSGGLTQQVDGLTGWGPDTAHQPNLSFVPYVLTGERWMLDNQLAQASFNVMSIWPQPRQGADDIVVQDVQLRAAAWSLREIEDAAWAAPDGSAERAYFRSVADANWRWLVSKIPEWTAIQGEAHGWVPGVYGGGGLPPWQQDFFASTTIAAASRGSADAMTFLNWQKNFLIGRFLHDEDGFRTNDGAAYVILIKDPATGRVFDTWSEIGARTIALGISNGTGWENGYYGQLALATLAGIYYATGDAQALDTYEMLVALNPYVTGAGDFASFASYAVTIPGEYGAGINDDIVTLQAPVTGRSYDFLTGNDKLVLADGGNSVIVANIETVVAGSGNDVVTVRAVSGPLAVDLGRGLDRLFLPDGWNTVDVSNVERIVGGSSRDTVTLRTQAVDVVVDLGRDNDRLTLSSDGPNTVTVRNVETIIGGTDDDDVTVTTSLLAGNLVDLGDGDDRLTLASGLGNTVTVTNVETIRGGAGTDAVTLAGSMTGPIHISGIERFTGRWGIADTVILDDPMQGGTIDLSDGADTLVLSAAGPNTVTVVSVENIVGSANADDVQFGWTPFWGAAFDLGGGADTLRLFNGVYGSRVTVTNIETVIGSTGGDEITLGTPVQDGFVDLGGGSDTLILSSRGTNRVTVSNVEVITGGTRNDSITILSPERAAARRGEVATADAGGASAPITMTLRDVDRVKGSNADEIITFLSPTTDAVVNLGAGRDSVTLSDWAPNSITLSNVETIIGRGAADTVTIGAAPRREMTIDLGGNPDRLVFTEETGSVRAAVSNVETIIGAGAAETITINGGSWNAITVDLGGGNDTLLLSDTATAVIASNVETIRGGAGNDRITVAGNAAASVSGGAGNDAIAGGAGNDTLAGGLGVDQLTGGAGSDRFVFSAVADSPLATPDVITDFSVAADKLAFTGLLQGSFAWRGTGGFTATGNSEARYTAGSQVVQVDVNGDGVADIGIQLNGVTMSGLSAAVFDWT